MLILPESWDESKTDFKGEVDGFNNLKQLSYLNHLCNYYRSRFYLNSHTTGFHPLTEKFELCTHPKEMVPYERTAEKVSFEWWHHKISSSDSKMRTKCNENI